MDTRFKNFQLERKRECASAEYLWHTSVLYVNMTCDLNELIKTPLALVIKASLTTVYKAGLSKVGDLYNLVTKNVTKYAVLTTLKILKITKKTYFFEKNFSSQAPQKFFQKLEMFFL